MKAYLSYARADLDVARELAEGLRDSGHRLWFDEFELPAGLSWGTEIDKALTASNAMIVLISPESMASKEVRREIESALLSPNFAHNVLPVYLRPTRDVPWFLRTISGIEAGPLDHSQLVKQVKEALDSFEKRTAPAKRG